jgi:hypothetical protein
MEGLQQRANEGHPLPQSMGVVARRESGAARAGARRTDQSCLSPPRTCCLFGDERKRWLRNRNPRAFMPGRSQCPDLGKVYLVPVSEVTESLATLRVDELNDSRWNRMNKKRVRWAQDYEL